MGSLTVRRVRHATLAGLLAGFALLIVAGSVIGADAVTFGKPTASSTFGKSIEFKQPVEMTGKPRRAEILLTTPGAIGPTVIPSSNDAGTVEFGYTLDLSDGHIVPNTTFIARWRVVDATGKTWTSPAISHTYADDRFTWKTLTGDIVRVHWIEGDQAFGERALKIGDDAVAATAKLLGVTETEPIDFFIYADQAPFYAALGPATRENVGGQAHPDIRTLFALITPADIGASWVESVVPHELTHLVFATAVDNPYHDPPHWLNEGLAVYLADGYGDVDRAQVKQAARDGTIIPLDGLAGAFPTTRERFFLAYAESVSTVDRIVRVNGKDALVKLVRSYADGVSDDEAFTAALGRDVAGFEKDWLAELGAQPPTRRGPVVAPVGPLPDGWSGPRPDPSFEVIGSQPPVRPGSRLPESQPAEDLIASVLRSSVGLIGIALIVVLGALAVRRARRRTDVAAWAVQGDNRLFGRPPTPDDEAAGPASALWSADWTMPGAPADEDGESESTALLGSGEPDGATAKPPDASGEPVDPAGPEPPVR